MLASRLLQNEAAEPREIIGALAKALAETRPFASILSETKPAHRAAIEREFARSNVEAGEAISVDRQLVLALPAGMCPYFLAVPLVRRLGETVVDIACVDPFDVHAMNEFRYHLGLEVRKVRVSFTAMYAALAVLPHESKHPRVETPAFGNRALPRDAVPDAGTIERHEPIPLVRVLPDSDVPRTRRGLAPPAGVVVSRVPLSVPANNDAARSSAGARGDKATKRGLQDEPVEDHHPTAAAARGRKTSSSEPALDAPNTVRPALGSNPILEQERSLQPQAKQERETGEQGQVAEAPVAPPISVVPEVAAPRALPVSAVPPTMPQFELTEAIDDAELLAGLARITSADSADTLLETIASVLGYRARLLVVFGVKGNSLRLRLYFDASGVKKPDSELVLSTTEPSILARALTEQRYQGFLSDSAADLRLVPLLAGSSGRVLAAAVSVAGKPALVVALGGFDRGDIAERWLDSVATRGAEVLTRILRAKKTR